MSSNKHKFVDNVNKYIMFSKVAEDTLIYQETYRKEIEMKQDPN